MKRLFYMHREPQKFIGKWGNYGNHPPQLFGHAFSICGKEILTRV